MKYYLYMAGNANGSLRQVDMDSNPVILERWDTKARKWIFSPETIAVTGLSSDGDSYREITEREATRIRGAKNETRKKR